MPNPKSAKRMTSSTTALFRCYETTGPERRLGAGGSSGPRRPRSPRGPFLRSAERRTAIHGLRTARDFGDVLEFARGWNQLAVLEFAEDDAPVHQPFEFLGSAGLPPVFREVERRDHARQIDLRRC